MSWQDLVLGVVQWIFLVALIPSIVGKHKPEFPTSMITGILLCVQAAVFYSLRGYVSAISTFLVACGWFILAWQRRHD